MIGRINLFQAKEHTLIEKRGRRYSKIIAYNATVIIRVINKQGSKLLRGCYIECATTITKDFLNSTYGKHGLYFHYIFKDNFISQ